MYSYQQNLVEKTVKNLIDKEFAGQKMTLSLANKMIERVMEKATSMKAKVVVAISDEKARPVAVQCMDGSYIGSYDVALNKTFTSIAFGRSTKELGKLAQPGKELYGIQFTNEGKIVIFGGGDPLISNGKMIGAIGVSGGTAEQDTKLSEYGASILEEVIACLQS